MSTLKGEKNKEPRGAQYGNFFYKQSMELLPVVTLRYEKKKYRGLEMITDRDRVQDIRHTGSNDTCKFIKVAWRFQDSYCVTCKFCVQGQYTIASCHCVE